ncbi:hypothetical protein [Aestuariibaculum lutulentum]|uniref:SPOR domain-containing protein n=1 Tax=Aestuariibaculum lutulentum TaxID=2920935 RepID=A0ABS9RGN0_9FLAO|nr:hypothetical protein [Aestuariibaculum lutulentum]MCH4552067.1 hypothetical protein [Aestuariibaculum lutulentum]
MKQLICLKIAILFCGNLIFSQVGLEFHPNKQFYLKGNSALTGNTILGVDAQNPYHDTTEINDSFSLVYIDIDQDSTTFSSSSADLLFEKNSKIAYAALYWSATYPFEFGEKKKSNHEIIYQGDPNRDQNINSVLLKTPTSNTYLPITGGIIFDSYEQDIFKYNTPYVCYADVTKLLQETSQVNGTYTVANIKAAQGYISGGSSGGWLLYVIYKSETETPKYFTTYNGLIGVESDPATIYFNNFKTPAKGNIKTSLSIATLEGDRRITSDYCAILDSDSNNFINLKSNDREENNFFNSSITINSETDISRNPNSTNTLGFDLVKIDVPNENNAILKPNSTETAIQLSTKVDRYYPFFIAFETEISTDYYLSKQNNFIASTENTPINTFDTVSSNISENTISETPETLTYSTDISEAKKLEIDKKINASTPVTVPNLEKGYYLVTNVFKNKIHTTNWITFLNEKGYRPNYYINPENNWYYVYIQSNSNPYPIFIEKEKLSQEDYFKGLWVAKINY